MALIMEHGKKVLFYNLFIWQGFLRKLGWTCDYKRFIIIKVFLKFFLWICNLIGSLVKLWLSLKFLKPCQASKYKRKMLMSVNWKGKMKEKKYVLGSA